MKDRESIEEEINLLKPYISKNKLDLFELIAPKRTRYISILLEDVFQPHNLAAVLRSADCFGVQDVHIVENNNMFKPNQKISRGAQKWLNVYQYNKQQNNTEVALTHLQSQFKIVATTPPMAGSYTTDTLPINEPLLFVFGTEKKGISQTILNKADYHLSIPMYGFTESFNISVAAALILNDIKKRLLGDEINHTLSKEDQELLKLEWYKRSVKNYDLILKK